MSRPRVTITLGQSGQVVKRGGAALDGSHLEYTTISGGKHSIRGRLGSNVNNPQFYGKQPNTKRRRQVYVLDSERQYISNARIGREDLRLKLMHKNSSRRALSDSEHNELREKLSRTIQSRARVDTRSHMPEPRVTGFRRRIPPNRSADDLLHMGLLRKPYRGCTLEDLRRRSSRVERIFDPSGAICLPRSMDGSRKIPLVSPVDASRFMSSIPRTTVYPEAAKPVLRLVSAPSEVEQKSSYLPTEELTVRGLLHSLGLGKYSLLFQAEEVDMTALKQMRNNDLKELGIPMGPRKKILLALPRPRTQQPWKAGVLS